MYKRKENQNLFQVRPRELRQFEADICIEHYSNNDTCVSSVLYQGALPIKEQGLTMLDSFNEKQKSILNKQLIAM